MTYFFLFSTKFCHVYPPLLILENYHRLIHYHQNQQKGHYQLNIPFRLINHKALDANTITQLAPIIINTTPLGMHPNTNTIPNIDYSQITPNHLIYDLVYNPTETRFLQLAKQQGATTQNGLAMLHRQADAALKIWLK